MAVAASLRGPSLGSLSGAQKSAVLCMALGAEQAARILQQLAPAEVETVSREIASMPAVSPEVVNAVVEEFQQVSKAVDSVARGGVEYAQQVLEQALGSNRARDVLDRVEEQMVDSGLKRLRKAAPQVLAGILRGEHPQSIALILAHLDVRQAAKVVEAMDVELAAEVLYRVARMEKISPEMLALVEAGLSGKTDVSLTEEMTVSGGAATAAKLLNLTPGTLEKSLLEAIGRRNADIARGIEALMFVFEDLLQIDGRGIQRILRDIETKDLALALKVATKPLKKHITSNMSERAASALEEEMEIMGPVRVRDVEAAQMRIIEAVRALEQAGEILIRKSGASDDIVT
ncbi:MAG TPA: flagellar motor switch protein FliG [Terriglobales bacterium]|nr:flagellar motor switch protein FliG [Terriglobales bacterium]